MELFDEPPGELLLAATIPWPNGKPKVKDRPRFANNRVYTPKDTLVVEQAIADYWDDNDYPTFDQPIEVQVEFTNTDIRVSIFSALSHENKKLRGDLDNYLKLVLDALNEHAYTDDRIIVKLSGEKL